MIVYTIVGTNDLQPFLSEEAEARRMANIRRVRTEAPTLNAHGYGAAPGGNRRHQSAGGEGQS